tara:strand:- start:841 stop:2436 length:1596 start_codon:yes stop_codon:yes gene_type:complete
MALNLKHSGDLSKTDKKMLWLSTTDTKPTLSPILKWNNVAERLERAYNSCEETCWTIGRSLAENRSSDFARTPTMGAYGTDFRLMLAWVILAKELVSVQENFLIVCDDPWLYREIADLDGVFVGRYPKFWKRRFQLKLRGFFSRCKNSFKLAVFSFKLKYQRNKTFKGKPTLIVYGHPTSKNDGTDAYFGDLMKHISSLQRVLHTDCDLQLSRDLEDDRTTSLHAWGNPLFALSLIIGSKWHIPSTKHLNYHRLVNRAIEIENSGSGILMTRWQAHCQTRWMKETKPTKVIWPWENFSWERLLCRQAAKTNIKTLGYQHTVIGEHQINFASRLNPSKVKTLPDKIICNGPAFFQELIDWGHRPETLVIGGAFRISPPYKKVFNKGAPIFVALSGLLPIANEQLILAKQISEKGKKVLFRPHPMYPVNIRETDTLIKAEKEMLDHSKLSLVVFSTGTLGLEAVLAGLPTIRFLPDDRVAVQVLPKNVKVPTATGNTLPVVLTRLQPPMHITWESIFSRVDYSVWQRIILNYN